MKRIINMRVLPGQPLDGTGKVCIHLFVPDERGPFTEPSVLGMGKDEDGNPCLVSEAVRGRLACDPTRKVEPVVRGNVTSVTMRSDDPRAVTCPKCKQSKGYVSAMELLNNK